MNSGRLRANRSRTRAVDVVAQKQRTLPQVRGELVATAHTESRDADSESFRTCRICQDGGKCTIPHFQWKLIGVETVLRLCAENTQNQDILKGREYKQILPIMLRSDQRL